MRLASRAILVVGRLRGVSLRFKSRAIEPLLSRNSNGVLYLKFGRTWRLWAVWSVRFCVVRIAIDGPRRASRTAEPECFDMFRVADRPPAHAGSKLHEFNWNRRGERSRIIATLPIDHELRGGLPPAAEPAFRCGWFNRTGDLAILLSQPFHWRHFRFRVGPIAGCYLLSPHGYNLWTTRLRVAGLRCVGLPCE